MSGGLADFRENIMEFWQTLLIQTLATGLVVLLILWGFYRWVLKPALDRKVEALLSAARAIEPAVTRGVKQGVNDALRELPETTARESTRQFLRFGSDLFENGLSSLLGSSADLASRRAQPDPDKSAASDDGSSDRR